MANRISNSFKNIASSIGLKLLLIGLQFALKTIFIYNLGVVFNGVNSFLNSFLSYLNIAELGIGSAIVFSMYKPVADKDEEKTLQYLQLYKTIYSLLGLFVAVIGLVMMPFLPFMIKGLDGAMTLGQVYIIYVLYLANSVLSYFLFCDRGGLLTANQSDYKLTPINYTAQVLIIVLQGLSLMLFKGFNGFLIYTIVPIAITIIQKLTNGICVGKWFPYVKKKPVGKLSKDEKKTFFKRVYAMAISKICVIINNSLDSLVISFFVGIALLGKYQNYYTLILMVSGFVGVLFSSMSSSVGNLAAEADVSYSKQVFKNMFFFAFWIYGFCAICYFVVVQPFVAVWIGNENVINDFLMIFAIALNFLTNGLCMPATMFRDGYGLHHQGRYRPVIMVILNVGYSILLGYFLGITGIVLATTISRFLILWWFDPYVYYKNVLKESIVPYLLDYLLKLLIIFIVGGLTFFICSLYPFDGILKVVLNALTAVVVVNLTFFILYFRTKEFKYFLSILGKFFKRKKIGG